MSKNNFPGKAGAARPGLSTAIKILLYLAALTPVVLLPQYSFPYITVRTVFLRAVLEIAAIFFLWLVLRNKTSLAGLKKNYFFWLWSGLLAVELVAGLAGQSFLVSFFSNLERMWGIFTVAHLFLFYFLARSFFEEKDWTVFLNVSLAASLLVSGYGIIQRFPSAFHIYVFEAGLTRIASTLGNPEYVAIYMLFSLAFALILFFRNRHRPLKYFYLAVIAIDIFAFALTDIRGAYLGLISGAGLALFLYLFLGNNKKLKIGFASLLVAGLLITGLVIASPKNKVFLNAPILNRLATISLSGPTAQTRFMSWNAAWQGFKSYPVLGVGMENFNVIFNKYFRANYYSLAPTETYFDRAHNQYLNLLAESGPAALLFYLGLFFFVGYYLIKGYRAKRFELYEFLILAAMATAYAVHIFFVFDDVNSFLFFAVLLAFVEFRYQGGVLTSAAKAVNKRSLPVKAALAAGLIVLAFSVYSFNYKVLRAAGLSAQAYMVSDFTQKISYFNQSLDMNVIPAEDLVTNDVDYLTSLYGQLDQIGADKNYVKILDGAIKKAQAALQNEIVKKPTDAFLYLKQAQLDNFSYLVYNDKKYLDEAVADSQKGLELSPERLQLFYVLGESYVIGGQNQAAISILEKALRLNQNFSASYYYLGRAYLADEQVDKAYDYIMNQAIGARNYRPENSDILLALSQKFSDKKDYAKVVAIYEKVLRIDPKNVKVTAALAAAYVQTDQYDKAIAAAQRAAAMDFSFAVDAELFIKMIKAGQFQQLKEMTR